MKYKAEYFHSLGLLVLLLVVYTFAGLTKNIFLLTLLSLFSIIVGSSLVIFGFWGSDFAFALASKQLNQSRERGLIRGKKGKVYVPFMGNYTPLEWWNLNWFFTIAGSVLLALGMFVLGFLLKDYLVAFF